MFGNELPKELQREGSALLGPRRSCHLAFCSGKLIHQVTFFQMYTYTHTHRLKFIFFVFIKEINFHCRCVGKPRKQNQPSPCFSFSCRGWEGEGYTLQGLEGEENAVSLKADAL